MLWGALKRAVCDKLFKEFIWGRVQSALHQPPHMLAAVFEPPKLLYQWSFGRDCPIFPKIYPHPVTKICNRKYCVKTLRERSFQFKRHYITLRYIILSLRKLHFQLYNAIASKIVHLSTWNFVHLLQNLLTIYAENFIYLSQKMAKLHKKQKGDFFFWPTLYIYLIVIINGMDGW